MLCLATEAGHIPGRARLEVRDLLHQFQQFIKLLLCDENSTLDCIENDAEEHVSLRDGHIPLCAEDQGAVLHHLIQAVHRRLCSWQRS